LRQVALICLMAQCGSFVPAKSTKLALVDRIFTRIGAGDNLASGKSTFLVEMEETALICHYATKRSLVILDEVGRGTSTFDGLAIAQAVVEYIHSKIQARCLFATHYHELTALKDKFPGIESYFAISKKTDQGIMFMYKIARGIADGSFGIEVAKLAQLPKSLIGRAEEILHDLTICQKAEFSPAFGPSNDRTVSKNSELIVQIERLENILKAQGDKLAMLKAIDYDDLSPKKAFDLLWHFRDIES